MISDIISDAQIHWKRELLFNLATARSHGSCCAKLLRSINSSDYIYSNFQQLLTHNEHLLDVVFYNLYVCYFIIIIYIYLYYITCFIRGNIVKQS